MIAAILLAWLKLLALDGDLAKAEPRTLRYRVLHVAARPVRGGMRRRLKIQAAGQGRGITAACSASTRSRKHPSTTVLRSRKEKPCPARKLGLVL